MGGISHYGVWVGQPIRYEAQTPEEDPKSPHIYLYFKDDSNSRRDKEAAINVKSTDKDTRLVFWFDKNFSHPVTTTLEQLDEGFHLSSRSHRRGKIEGLDFLRTKDLVSIDAGTVLPSDVPGPDNDILDKMEPILNDAIKQQAKIYIYGSSYGSGIHDIHMNQGSLPSYSNGIYEDGALLFRFPDGHWEAVFLAFASQKIPTDDRGEYESGSKSLADILGSD